MTRAVNKLKRRSKTNEVASVGLKVTKACLYSFEDRPIHFLVKIGLRTTLDELARPSVELQELLIEAEDPYFELKNGGLRALKRLFELEGVLAQLTSSKNRIAVFLSIIGLKMLLKKAEKAAGPMDIP